MSFAGDHIATTCVAMVFHDLPGGEKIGHPFLAVGTFHLLRFVISDRPGCATICVWGLHPGNLAFVTTHGIHGHFVRGRIRRTAGLTSGQSEYCTESQAQHSKLQLRDHKDLLSWCKRRLQFAASDSPGNRHPEGRK